MNLSSVLPSTASMTRPTCCCSRSTTAPWMTTMLGCLSCRRIRSSLASAEERDTASLCSGRTSFTATSAPQKRPQMTRPKPPLPKTLSGRSATSLGSRNQCSCCPRASILASWPAMTSLPSSSKTRPVSVVCGAEPDPEGARGASRASGPCSSRNSALHRSTRSCTSCTKAARSLASRARSPTAAAMTRPARIRRFMTGSFSGLPSATRRAYRSTASTSKGAMTFHLTGAR
mmetsp:Transcript_10878/g.33746  ORF Transcript_10878/g.33746 Transcript_10878/m.33746 type:complete len:231 (+) Transcript_10878:1221-1913(+)